MRLKDLYTVRFAIWLYHVFRKDCMLITYETDLRTKRFRETMRIAHVTEAQAYSMGFQRGVKIKDNLGSLGIHTYVRFVGIHRPEPFSYEQDGETVVNRETSATLYDYHRSNSIQTFLKGMLTKTAFPMIDIKVLAMVAAIAVAAAAGVLWVVMR